MSAHTGDVGHPETAPQLNEGSSGVECAPRAFSPFGVDLFGQPIEAPKRGPLATRFEFPPFSVLDARSGEWQDRKRAWVGMGIESEIGRGSMFAVSESARRLAGGYSSEDGAMKASGATSVSVLVTSCGSLPLRVGKQFEASRKLGKTHQNVLVFKKPMKVKP